MLRRRTAAEGQTQDAMPPITIGAEAGPKSMASVALPMGPLVLPPPILTRERQAFPQPDFAAQPASQPSEERPNSKKRIPCAFYLKTGNCAFGNECAPFLPPRLFTCLAQQGCRADLRDMYMATAGANSSIHWTNQQRSTTPWDCPYGQVCFKPPSDKQLALSSLLPLQSP